MSTRQTHRRLYTPREMAEAREAWLAAMPSKAERDEWRDWRHLAAMEGGIIVPPKGTKWDQWDERDPSERAIIARAIRETPKLLREAIAAPGPASWAKVVAIVCRARDDWGEQADREEEWERQRRKEREPGIDESMEVLSSVLGRVLHSPQRIAEVAPTDER